MSSSPEAQYRLRHRSFSEAVQTGQRRLRNYANGRLAVFVAIVLFAVLAYRGSLPALAALAAAIVGFVFLIRKHERLHAEHERNEALVEINRRGLARLADHWHEFPDRGDEYRNADHRYAIDLDLFGQGSLFQFASTAVTHWGRDLIARRLTEPPRERLAILADQDAAEELSQKLDWMQRFRAEGARTSRKAKHPAELLAWAERDEILIGQFARWVYLVFPLLTLTALALGYFGVMAWGLGTFLVAVQLGLFFSRAKWVFEISNQLRSHGEGVEVYRDMLDLIEREPFRAQRSEALAGQVMQPSASGAIGDLARIIGWLDVQRTGIIHLILNALVLWDFQFLHALQSWRKKHGVHVRGWLEALAELEALTAWATVRHDFPDWVRPEITDGLPAVAGERVAHPLISAANRVANDVALGRFPSDAESVETASVLVITGSNMSGKSTYMRTVGVNLVLAYTGAPVCAERFRCSRMEVYTSMRNTDNLEKSISSFYAELLRMKMVLAAAQQGVPMLFLFDEIFRGTNSADRHTGAVGVLRKLRKLGAIGMVSTHDLELGQVGETEPEFAAYHLAESYEGDRIIFDYKLRPGVSPTRNAVALMRMVGILE
jgi:ABC-type multidrug transport system fused ATPase/permease subunit